MGRFTDNKPRLILFTFFPLQITQPWYAVFIRGAKSCVHGLISNYINQKSIPKFGLQEFKYVLIKKWPSCVFTMVNLIILTQQHEQQIDINNEIRHIIAIMLVLLFKYRTWFSKTLV